MQTTGKGEHSVDIHISVDYYYKQSECGASIDQKHLMSGIRNIISKCLTIHLTVTTHDF